MDIEHRFLNLSTIMSRHLIATTLLVAALGLAACAPANTDSPAPADPSATSTPVTDPVETPAPADPVAGMKSGDTISADVARDLNAKWGRVVDDRGYQMPNGEYVLLKGNKPLPEKVTQAVTEVVTPKAAQNYQAHDFNQSSADAWNAAKDAQEAATGRQIAFVIHGMNASGPGKWEPKWSVGGNTEGYNGDSKEEAIAVAQKWVNVSPGARAVVVVDALQ